MLAIFEKRLKPKTLITTPNSDVIYGIGFLDLGKDGNEDFLMGSWTYKLTLPANVPANLFWSATVYDAKTAAGLNNGQDYPSIGDRDKPVQNADGSTDLYFGPKAPKGKERNWMKTVPGKGWFGIIRLYGPGKGWFDRTWVPGDLERME